ncbi:glycosyltransferase [Flavobacterium enshiense DK69]|nr:glycosyltransferase [Flavobacterium enshiense DK69]
MNHVHKEGKIYGYGPYIREMNVWLNYVDEVEVVGPFTDRNVLEIDLAYRHSRLQYRRIPLFSLTSKSEILKTFFKLPVLFWVIYKSMKRADHLHLRCPGNVGLIACLVQILFPSKIKTAKYAGNWDMKSKQPWSYRFQKWILNNTFLTRNMQVLVYGEWENCSRNIMPFFTASYSEKDKKDVQIRKLLVPSENRKELIKFLFVGTLSEGKRPFYAVQLVQALKNKGYAVTLDIYGEGNQRAIVEEYINAQLLKDTVILHGNKNAETVLNAYQESHFLILPSKSEGWPKVVAEAMFWGCVPVATSVSCVPFMVDRGNRGGLLTMNLIEDVENLMFCIEDDLIYEKMASKAMDWSRQYTLDYFESEVKALLKEEDKL